MMTLSVIPAHFVDKAWEDGASCLGEVCKLVDEITDSQLKMILSRGERTLIALREDDKTIGWGCWRIEQLPNMRVLFITDLVAHGAHYERFFDELKKAASAMGCSRIRCAAQPVQARLYRMKTGFKPIYEILEVSV